MRNGLPLWRAGKGKLMKKKQIEKILFSALCEKGKVLVNSFLTDVAGERHALIDISDDGLPMVRIAITGKECQSYVYPGGTLAVKSYYRVLEFRSDVIRTLSPGWTSMYYRTIGVEDVCCPEGRDNLTVPDDVAGFVAAAYGREPLMQPSIDCLVCHVQSVVSVNKAARAEDNRRKKCRSAQEAVPKIPSGFNNWVRKKFTARCLSLEPFRKKREAEAECSVCGGKSVWKRGEIRVGERKKCPACGTLLPVVRRGHEPGGGTSQCLIQMAGDRVLFRHFSTYSNCYVGMDGNLKTNFSCSEYAREFKDVDILKLNSFRFWSGAYHRYWYRDGRWDDRNGNSFAGDLVMALSKAFVYPGSLSALPENVRQDFAWCGLMRAAKEGVLCAPEAWVSTSETCKMLRRNGLYKAAEDCYGFRFRPTPEEFFGISSAMAERMRKGNLGSSCAAWLRDAPELSDDVIRWFSHEGIFAADVDSLHLHNSYEEIGHMLKRSAAPQKLARKIQEHPEVELLVKTGAVSLADELDIKRDNVDLSLPFPKAIGLTKEQFRRVVRMNGGADMLKWLRFESASGEKIADEDLSYLLKSCLSTADLSGIALSLKKKVNYIRKQSELCKAAKVWTYMGPRGLVGQWKDYLDMARKLGRDMSLDLVLRPTRLKEAHDAAAACLRTISRRQEIENLFPGLDAVLKDLKRYEFEADGFCVRMPDSIDDIIREGTVLGHCLDKTDRYFERICKRESFIGFLRKSDKPDKPFYTLEFEPDGTCRQKRTYGDRQDKDFDACKAFIVKWQKHLKTVLTQDDKKLQELSAELRLAEFRQLRKDGNKIFHGPLAGKLLADVLEGDLMVAAV